MFLTGDTLMLVGVIHTDSEFFSYSSWAFAFETYAIVSIEKTNA